MLSRFHLISERHGQIDGPTDIEELLYQYGASAYWRAIKNRLWMNLTFGWAFTGTLLDLTLQFLRPAPSTFYIHSSDEQQVFSQADHILSRFKEVTDCKSSACVHRRLKSNQWTANCSKHLKNMPSSSSPPPSPSLLPYL